MTVHSRDKCII